MIDKKIQLTFNSTVNKRVKVRSNCELYSHDKNNNEFELTIGNYTLTNEEITVLFKFVKSVKYWETQGTIEDNKIKFKFDTTLITDNERVNCYIILKNEEKESDIYSFSFDVKMSEYDLKDNLPIKERYFANGVVVDKLDVLTKEVLAAELEKAKTTFALKTDLSEFVRTSDISDVVRTSTLNDYQLKSEMPNVVEIVNNTLNGKGYLTEHQSLTDYATKEELRNVSIDTSNLVTKTELENKRYLTTHQDLSYLATKQELEQVRNNQPTVDTSNLATKEELRELRGSQPNVDNLVTKDELNSKHYLTEHQDISNLATKDELREVSNRQPTVDTSNLATKEQLRKAFLDEEDQEKYAKKTELPQPYNDTDITNRLIALENRPAGNVDTSNFVTKRELNEKGFLKNNIDIKELGATFDSGLTGKLYKSDTAFQFTEFRTVNDFFNIDRLGKQDTEFYGKVYYNRNERKIYKGANQFVDLNIALYTLANAFPDNYQPDYEFGDYDNVKLITNKTISNYLPTNTGNTGNTTELDKRLKVLEAKQWEIHGRGMPNGTVTAPIGTTYVDEAVTNGALKWIKKTGTGNTGWVVISGDTGWKTVKASSLLGNSYIKIRRINDTVFYQFGGLSWGWFGVVRRTQALMHPSERERNCVVINGGNIPLGFRATASLIGQIFNDKGTPYGTWYLGSATDANHMRFQFTDPLPTDRDIGDIRVSAVSYVTDDAWPLN